MTQANNFPFGVFSWAPITSANVTVGFDSLGFALARVDKELSLDQQLAAIANFRRSQPQSSSASESFALGADQLESAQLDAKQASDPKINQLIASTLKTIQSLNAPKAPPVDNRRIPLGDLVYFGQGKLEQVLAQLGLAAENSQQALAANLDKLSADDQVFLGQALRTLVCGQALTDLEFSLPTSQPSAAGDFDEPFFVREVGPISLIYNPVGVSQDGIDLIRLLNTPQGTYQQRTVVNVFGYSAHKLTDVYGNLALVAQDYYYAAIARKIAQGQLPTSWWEQAGFVVPDAVETSAEVDLDGTFIVEEIALTHAPATYLYLGKDLPIGSGLGSSACTTVAVVKALEAYYQAGFSEDELIRLCGQIEGSSSGGVHYDNVAPALLGGQTLSSVEDNKFVSSTNLPCPFDLAWVLFYPGVEVKTADARKALPEAYKKSDAIVQANRLALYVHACHTGNQELALSVLKDNFAEPYRLELVCAKVHGLRDFIAHAQAKHVVHAGVSGSGPTIYFLVDKAKVDSFIPVLEGFAATCPNSTIELCQPAAGAKVLRLDYATLQH